MNAFVASVAVAMASLPCAGCFDWHYDTTARGLRFDRVRTEANGVVVGQLQADSIVSGRACRRGWIHLHPNGVPAGFTASSTFSFGRLEIPGGTWVIQNDAGEVTVCAFARDTVVQGQACRGTGGPKGVQASFYPSGALKQFYPVRETRIDGVPCDTGLVRGWVELHENGRLKSGLLRADLQRDGVTIPRGTRIQLDETGRLLPPAGH